MTTTHAHYLKIQGHDETVWHLAHQPAGALYLVPRCDPGLRTPDYERHGRTSAAEETTCTICLRFDPR